MWAWLVKFLGGFAFWKADKLGKILFVSAIAVVCCLILWKAFLCKTTATTIGKGSVVNYYYQDCSDKVKDDTFTVLKIWKFRLLSLR